MSWVEEALQRVQPGPPAALTPTELGIVGAVALVLVLVPPLWRVARLGVTLVHELGHAIVGIVVGRTFTGFVLRGDASGHAVTRGRGAGPGLVATTWAGYPAPALLAAGVAVAVGRGWAAPVLAVFGVVLLVALVQVRSVLTAAVTVGALAGVAALWWFGEPELQSQVLTGVAAVLLVGAWRHLIAAWRDRSAGNDARVLARLAKLPRTLWLATFALVCGWAAWVVVTTVR
ncbi:M50 family metallopeptidase [Pseudactinotalea terrae]|uniref:M50 family metallopeptidase n=1 Tax=Pseudactinotalea terrae TaxID=1743262 RepID=UPI0012E2A325|nr:M50 family metallopeptidase [Pseudactinotalea terrae]